MPDTPDDDLEELLTPRPGELAPGLRESVLRQTERRLTRVRWVRFGARAAAVAALFLVGGAAGWFLRTPVAHVPGPPEVVVVPVIVPVALPPVADAPGSPPLPLSPTEAELRAEQSDDRVESARLYRRAGDAFLTGEDYANAARCYRLFLARAGDTALSPEPDDTWLLTSLKNSAYKEKTDAQVHD